MDVCSTVRTETNLKRPKPKKIYTSTVPHKITFCFRAGLLSQFTHLTPKQEGQTSNIVEKTIKTAIVIVKRYHDINGNTTSSAHVTTNLGEADEAKQVFAANQCGAWNQEAHYLSLAGVPQRTPFVGHTEKCSLKEVKEWGKMFGYSRYDV